MYQYHPRIILFSHLVGESQIPLSWGLWTEPIIFSKNLNLHYDCQYSCCKEEEQSLASTMNMCFNLSIKHIQLLSTLSVHLPVPQNLCLSASANKIFLQHLGNNNWPAIQRREGHLKNCLLNRLTTKYRYFSFSLLSFCPSGSTEKLKHSK